MSKKGSKGVFQKVFIILGGGAFVLFSIAGVFSMMGSNNNSSNEPTVEQQLSQLEMLQQQAEGYELVLAREPENPFVLENLLTLYLQIGDLQKALPLAEKLVSLSPDDPRYQQTLAAIKQGIVQLAQQQELLQQQQQQQQENQNQSNTNTTDVENQSENNNSNNQQTQP